MKRRAAKEREKAEAQKTLRKEEETEGGEPKEKTDELEKKGDEEGAGEGKAEKDNDQATKEGTTITGKRHTHHLTTATATSWPYRLYWPV